MAADYRITIKGQLDPHWSAWFEGLTITPGKNGETILGGPIEDQAALYGTLIKIRDLGLTLIAVAPAEPDMAEAQAHRQRTQSPSEHQAQ